MKIYIAGPDHCDYEKRFARAEELLTEQGHVVINPAMLPKGLGSCDTYMGIYFAMIDACDVVVMLGGWRESFGACREWGYARGTNKIVADFTTWLERE